MPLTTAGAAFEAVREAWAAVPAPPAEEMRFMEWGWGQAAAHAFVGVAPVDVDIGSQGFHAATPLLDLPPPAAAAYLGTYVMSLLEGIEFQQTVGLFDDIVSRAHTLTCLTLSDFWERVIRPWLPPRCRSVLSDVVSYLVAERELLALNQAQVNMMLTSATDHEHNA